MKSRPTAAGQFSASAPETSAPATYLLACCVLVASCTQEPKPPDSVIVEWVQVDGLCKEDHATESGHYSGDLVHWRNKATGVSSRYGSVNTLALLSEAAMRAKIEHPNRYRPPFSVEFSEIAATDFQSQNMVLHGISEDTEHSGRYETTCDLSVQRRLDHLPSDKERQEWMKSHSGPAATSEH